MDQAAQDGPFASKALFGAPRQRDVQELDRRSPIEAAVAPFREPDDAHAGLIMAQIFNLTLYVGRGFGTFSPDRKSVV